MDFLDKLLEMLGIGDPKMGYDTIKEPGTAKSPLNKEQKKLMEELADTEVLADIYNAQRTMEQRQVELGARYMDKYRSEVPGGVATLMFQPRASALGSAAPAGSIYNTLGTDRHQVRLKSLEGLEKAGYPPEKRDETIFHELGHIGEFITKDLIRAGVIPSSLSSDFQAMGKIGGLGHSDLSHTAIETMDDYYGRNQKYDKVGMREALEPTEFDKEKVLSKLKSKTVDDIQAEINAEQKRIGKGNWNSTLDELVAQRDRAKASPTKSIEVTDAEAKDIVLAEQARVNFQNRSPAEQILDDIFSKDLEKSMVAGIGRYYLDTDDEGLTASEKQYNAKLLKRLSEKYGFDVTNFSPENVAKMVDNMKKHTRTANELAEMIIEEGSY